MSRSMEFHFDSPWGLVVLVAVPLLLICLFAIERRRTRAAQSDTPFCEPQRVRNNLLAFLLVSILATVGGIFTTFWVLLVQSGDPFESPLFFVGLGLLGLVVLITTGSLWIKRRHRPVLLISSTNIISQVKEGRPSSIRFLAPLLRFVAILLVVVALARPQVATTEADVFAEGMDIVLTIDVSTSMQAVDFAPVNSPRDRKSRIVGAKKVIGRFIQQRTEDRLGLVVFAADAFTQCPLTLDYSVIQNILGSVKTGVIQDGTAIGNAIMVSVNRLKESEAKSKVIILLTDGDDNASKVSPKQATEIAAQHDIKVFPILVGKGGLVPYPVGKDIFGQMQYRKVEIRTNPELLKTIAKESKGKFYRAVDEQALEEDFQDILDHMEKSRLMDPGKFTRNTEVFQLALLPALLAILLELALSWTRFRRFP